jgi:hypothetical protein
MDKGEFVEESLEQPCEEDLDKNLECENDQFFFSYPHEVEDMMNDIPCQNIESHDPSFDDFERVNFEEILVDFPSSHEEDSRLGDKSLIDLFYIESSKWDINYFHFEGDPIYDTDYESEIDMDEPRTLQRASLRKFL